METILYHSNILSKKDVPFVNTIFDNLKKHDINLILTGWNPVPNEWGLSSNYYKIPERINYFKIIYNIDEIINEFNDNGLSIELMLERFNIWFNKNDNDKNQRISFLHFHFHHYLKLIKQYNPSLCLIWNGNDPRHVILGTLCDKFGIKKMFIERGPLPSVVFYDLKGVLSSSSISILNKNNFQIYPKQDFLESYSKWYHENDETLWEQPKGFKDLDEIKKKFNIADGLKITLFIGQIDNDIQTKLFSPYFSSNLEAFKWFVNNLRDENYFVIGKHHPKSYNSIDSYKDVFKGQKNIVWTDEIELNESLKLADNVVAVNSSVIFDALLCDKPVMSLGTTMLDSKNILYEYNPKTSQIKNDFYNSIGFEEKLCNFKNVLEYMFQNNLLFIKKDSDAERFVNVLLKEKEQVAIDQNIIKHEQVIFNYMSNVNLFSKTKSLTFKEKFKSDLKWYFNKILKKIL